MRMFNISKLLLASAAVALAGTGAIAQPADGYIRRHAADFFKFDGTEFFTSVTAAVTTDPALLSFLPPGGTDGALFFTKAVTPTPETNVLYVTLYTTGDGHDGAKSWFSCRISGPGIPVTPPATEAFCRTSAVGAIDTAPPGWITLLSLPAASTITNCSIFGDGGGGTADCHDNSITYSWCVPLPERSAQTTFTVDLKMATSSAGSMIFIEKGHVYIDSSKIKGSNRCVLAPTTAASSAAASALESALKAHAAKGEVVAGTATKEGHHRK